ncbi:MAG: TraR/DksA family transcriptional regulator [Nitrospinota bacterium]|nr:MAG: TraR/DksA family transcriptional regulator [Nitrospinota bacterium]
MRQALVGQMEKLKTYSQDMREDDIRDSGDVASHSYSKEVTLGLGENERNKLRLIEEALRKIEEGSYGKCEECEEEIPFKRLELLPFARYCVSCQSEFEKQGSAF